MVHALPVSAWAVLALIALLMLLLRVMKAFSASFWAVLAAIVLLTLLLRAVLDYREARAINLIIGLILGSFLFWLKGRSRENG